MMALPSDAAVPIYGATNAQQSADKDRYKGATMISTGCFRYKLSELTGDERNKNTARVRPAANSQDASRRRQRKEPEGPSACQSR